MSDQFIGQVLAEKYRVEELLHSDAVSNTYRATHLLMDKIVTVKILAPALADDENNIKQFAAEARAVSRLSHPNILSVHDYGQDKSGAIYIISEGLNGETLDKTLTREEKLPADLTVRIAGQIAAALTAAHTGGILHRHLNPEDIVFDPATEQIKVLNFTTLNRAAPSEKITLRQAAYLAPEQFADESAADERSDIYSLGVIFYEMLAGVVPFFADTPDELMHKKAEELPASLSAYREDFPPEIEPVILHALAKNPTMRQQDAAEFLDELNRAAPDSETENFAVARAAATDEKPNNLWKTAFVVLAGISFLAVALIYATSMKQTDPNTVLQMDANGIPVQPINPATGMNELGMANMSGMQPENFDNSNQTMPEVMPGGDGYDPWARGGQPPTGAPPPTTYVPPSGNYVTIPGDSQSPFTEDYVIVPVQPDANSNSQPPDSSKKKPKDTPDAKPSPEQTPTEKPANPPDAKPSPPKPKPTQKPKETAPATTEKKSVSGKEQDTQ